MDELKEKIMSMGFARNVWAEKRLCKLCPGNNIQRFMECLQIEDTSKQFDVIQDIISIMHEAYELQMKYSNSDYEPFEVTNEMIEFLLDEEELMELINRALAVFGIEGEVTVEAEPKKNADETIKST